MIVGLWVLSLCTSQTKDSQEVGVGQGAKLTVNSVDFGS